MRKTSILIPIILIVCLLALAYLIAQAFRAAGDEDGRGNDRIVLDENDYRNTDNEADVDPIDPDVTLGQDKSNNASGGTALDDYYADPNAGNDRNPDDYDLDDATDGGDIVELEPASPVNDRNPERLDLSDGDGRYLVVAGSFRQLSGAQTRIRNLQRAGFDKTRLARFNGGTYAVALAGQLDSYRSSRDLAQNINDAGFEAVVMRRRR